MHDFTVDQQNTPVVMGLRSIPDCIPMGQKFVPQAGRLDVVELWVEAFDAAWWRPRPYPIRVPAVPRPR